MSPRHKQISEYPVTIWWSAEDEHWVGEGLSVHGPFCTVQAHTAEGALYECQEAIGTRFELCEHMGWDYPKPGHRSTT